MDVAIWYYLRYLIHINVVFLQTLAVHGMIYEKTPLAKFKTNFLTLTSRSAVACCASCNKDWNCIGVSYHPSSGDCAFFAYNANHCNMSTNVSNCLLTAGSNKSSESEPNPEWDVYGRLSNTFVCFIPIF